jgi:hypothetical protein
LVLEEEVNWTASNTAGEILKLFQDIVAIEHITVLMSSDDPATARLTEWKQG